MSGAGWLLSAGASVAITFATWPLVDAQIGIESSPDLNMIQSVRVEPAFLDVSVGGSKTFRVVGNFTAISDRTATKDLIYGKYLGMALALIPGGDSIATKVGVSVAKFFAKLAVSLVGDRLSLLPRAGNAKQERELGVYTTSVSPPTSANAVVELTCSDATVQPSRVTGRAPTSTSAAVFYLA